MARRICNQCGWSLPKTSFSANQWKKKGPDGPASRCKDCIAGGVVDPVRCGGEENGGSISNPTESRSLLAGRLAEMILAGGTDELPRDSESELSENESDLDSEKMDRDVLDCIRHDLENIEEVMEELDEDEDFFETLRMKKRRWETKYLLEQQLEEIRTKEVVKDWEKTSRIYPEKTNIDDDNVECPICNKKMPLDGEEHDPSGADSIDSCYDPEPFKSERFFCCGARFCPSHVDSRIKPDCPACKKSLPTSVTDEYIQNKLLIHAAEGKNWAKYMLAEGYNRGIIESELDRTERLEQSIHWARLAADSGYVNALVLMSTMCFLGLGEGLPETKKERMHYMKKAADCGNRWSLLRYAKFCLQNDEEHHGTRYLTIATELGDDKIRAEAFYLLAEIAEKDKSTPSERLLYLYEQASNPLSDPAGKDGDPLAQHKFSELLYDISNNLYGSYDLPGFSPLPKMMYWAKKSASRGCYNGEEFLSMIKETVSTECMGCKYNGGSKTNRKKRRGKAKKLFPCKRCGAVYFCSDKCRIHLDSIGHLEDCPGDNRWMFYDMSKT